MRKACILLVLLIFSAAVAAPFCAEQSSGASARAGDVTVMSFGDTVEFVKTDSAQITFNVYNYGDLPAIVRLEKIGNSPIEMDTDGSVTVNGGSAVSFPAKIHADNGVGKGTYGLIVGVTVIDGGMETHTASLDLSVNIVGGQSVDSYRMKYMGVADLPEPFDNPVVVVSLTAVTWVAIAALCAVVVYLFTRHLARAHPEKAEHTARKAAVAVTLMVVISAVQNLMYILGVSDSLMDVAAFICRFLYIIFCAVAVWNIYKAFVSNVFFRYDAATGKADESLMPLMHLVGKIMITVVAVAYILAMLNVNVAGIVTVSGIAGLGVSLGARPAINEFLSGLALMFSRPFRLGDTVEMSDGKTMVVNKFGVLKTEFVTSYSNDVITVMNSTLMNSEIKNITWAGQRYRVKMSVKIPRKCSVELAKRLILECAYEEPDVITDAEDLHKPTVVMSSPNYHGGMLMTLVFYARKYGDNWDDQARIRERLLRKFSDNGMLDPYMKVKVNIEGGEDE